MSYTTYADIDNVITNLGQLTPPSKSTQDWVEALIAQVEDEINGRLGHIYLVPFTTVPSLISTIARYLVIAYILGPSYIGEVPEDGKWVDYNYKRGNVLLEKLEKGEIVLDAATVASDRTDTVMSSTSDVERTFTQTTYDSDGDVVDEGSMEGI